ncbi:MAG: FAD-dependent oxidoreductase [Phycisphaerales bacterium]
MTDRKRVLIVGGVAGGASTAARLRRLCENAEIILFERGEHISFANCGLPYHIGNTIKERERLLVQTPKQMNQRFRVDVRVRSEVVRIDRQEKSVAVRDLATGQEHAEPYDVLVLSPGAEPIRPPIPGAGAARVFTLRSLTDMDAIKKTVDEEKPGRAVVVGGGYIGLEMTEALVERGVQVSLVELLPQVMGTVDPEMAFPLHQELRSHGVELLLGTSVTGIEESGSKLLNVRLSDGQTRQAGLAIMSVGVRPDVQLARDAGLKIGQRGGIVVDDHMQTSDPSIFAVGDAVEVVDFVGGHSTLIPLAGPANRQGRIAADNICGRDSTYSGTQGTAICKVFSLAVATTGLNEKNLKRIGRRYEKVYVHPAHHAGYYPGASQISLKLLFDPQDGRILGAQAVGTSGVDKRIDVIAVAIRAGMTVRQLQDVELCYAPPFGSAKDPVNYVGFVASNVLAGDVAICHTEDVIASHGTRMLIDVRTPMEVKGGTIPGAVNIPLDEIRDHLNERPRDKEILVFCQVGLRGYIACRILAQAGFKCRNLTGGYKTYCATIQGIGGTVAAPHREVKSDTGEKA